jgi:hypothetical protein
VRGNRAALAMQASMQLGGGLLRAPRLAASRRATAPHVQLRGDVAELRDAPAGPTGRRVAAARCALDAASPKRRGARRRAAERPAGRPAARAGAVARVPAAFRRRAAPGGR